MFNHPPGPLPRAAPLFCQPRRCIEAWEEAGAPNRVLRWVREGLRLRFVRQPQPYKGRPIPIHSEDQEWLEGEMQRNLLLGSWTQLQECPHFCAPAFVVKNASGKRRVVVDLRFINTHLRERPVRFESLRSFRASVRPGMWMISLDLESGYHHVAMHPSSQVYLGFELGGRFFRCQALPFGLSPAPAVFTKLMRVLVRMWRGRGGSVLPYLDDFLFGFQTKEEATAAAVQIDADLASMGLRRNSSKGQWVPAQSIHHLGLCLDTKAVSFRSSPAVESRIRAFARDLSHLAARRQRNIPASMLAKFAGLAVSQLLAVPEARLMLRALHDCLALKQSWRSKVRLSSAALSELAWWQTSPWNEGAPADLPQPTLRVATDASDVGWGAAILGYRTEASGTFTPSEFATPIMVRELMAVKFALQAFASQLRSVHFELLVDNQAAAFSLLSLTSRSALARSEVVAIWRELRSLRSRMWVTWIPTEANVRADTLSRYRDRNDWRLDPRLFAQLCERWGRPHVDAFASRVNSQLPLFFARRPEPGASAVDGLAQPWSGRHIYANPPWPLISAVIAKLEREPTARATLVLPYWVSAQWYPRLLRLCSDMLVMEPSASTFRPAATGNSLGVGTPKWRMLLARVR